MRNAAIPWKSPHGHWSLEQAICNLAFGKSDEPLVPEKSADVSVEQWFAIREDRRERSWDSVRNLEDALNAREIQACGRELPIEIWNEPDLKHTGVALGDRAAIGRTVRGKSNKSQFRLSIDPLFRYFDAGITLVLKNDTAGVMDIVNVYVRVDVPEAKVRQLKRRIDFERTRDVIEPKRKLPVGRPPIPSRVMELYLEREKSETALPTAIEEARVCCDMCRAEDVHPETLARKIRQHRRQK